MSQLLLTWWECMGLEGLTAVVSLHKEAIQGTLITIQLSVFTRVWMSRRLYEQAVFFYTDS